MADYEYDLFVIGAGWGGVRASRIAASHGAKVAVAEEWYSETTAELIEATLHNALLFRLHLGWRPFEGHGFSFGLGYGWIGLGGGLTGSQAFAILTGYDFPMPNDFLEYDTQAVLHRLEAEADWEWLLKDHWLIRARLGGSYTFAAHVQLERQFEVPSLLEGVVSSWEEEGAGKLEDTFTRYVHTPILGIETGWRF